jgi:hypothetical protein
MITRLEKTLYRLEAQHASLAWAFEQIANKPGAIFELGLGLGRSFNHMRHKLGERAGDIVVFEREVRCYPDCTPDDDQLIVGNLENTLPEAAQKYAGQVVLAHSDVGSMDKGHNAYMSALVSKNLGPALAPGAIIMSDLPLDIEGCSPHPLPDKVRDDSYYLYTKTS